MSSLLTVSLATRITRARTRVVVGFAHVNISVTLGPISEREHFRNFKAYPGNISAPYFFFGALRARGGVAARAQYEARRRRTSNWCSHPSRMVPHRRSEPSEPSAVLTGLRLGRGVRDARVPYSRV